MPQTNPGTEVQDTEMTDASQQPRSANTSGTPDPGTATRASSRAKRRAPTIVLADQPRDTTARQDSAEGEPTQEWDSAQQEEQEEQKEPADTDEVSTASKRRIARSHALTGLRPDVKNDLPKRAIVRTKPRVIIPAPPPVPQGQPSPPGGSCSPSKPRTLTSRRP